MVKKRTMPKTLYVKRIAPGYWSTSNKLNNVVGTYNTEIGVYELKEVKKVKIKLEVS